MGLYFRHRTRGNPWLNFSRSGVSVSARRGRVTVNSRGSIWVRLGKGLFFRKG